MSVVGVLAAGVPISYIASCFDWFTAFMMINMMGLIVFFILVLGKDVKASYIQAGGGPPRLSKKSAASSSDATLT